ncbi:MAG: glycosyl transferase group 1 [Bacteroidia bacterium]|nr:MAG: glycosyl transferase group 1 [Bacteroidia bacterium]
MALIRVLHLARVINRYDFIDTIVRHLPRDRFAPEVATLEPQANIQEPQYAEIGLPHHLIPVPGYKAYPAYLRAAWQLSRLLRKRQTHILHTHHYWEGFVGALAKKLYPNFHLVVHRHYTEDIQRLPRPKRAVLERLEKWTYKQAQALVVPTDTMALFVKRTHTRLPPLHVIPYGFEFESEKYKPLSASLRESVRKGYALSDSHIVIANFASHRYQKGQHLLLEAFARLRKDLPQAVLWLVGRGPDTENLRLLAQKLGLLSPAEQPACLFLGWKTGEEVYALMGAADIIAHPTFSEAFPQVMVEALMQERALVITPVSGAKEWLKPQEHAWIVPIGQVEPLYEGLRTLAENPSLRQKLGQAGRKHLQAHLSYQAINPHYEALYTQLCFLSA